MELPSHVFEAIGTARSVSEAELLEAASNWTHTSTTFGLSPEEFAVSVAEALTGNYAYTILDLPRAPQVWQSMEVSNASALVGMATCTPTPTAPLPVTAVGQLAVRAWVDTPFILTSGYEIIPAKLILAIQLSATLSTFAQELFNGWADACLSFEGSVTKPSWTTANQLFIHSGARVTSSQVGILKYQGIFLEAVSESKVKWRFLSLYRILEHGYLVEVLEELKREFFLAPKESLELAVKAVSSEVNQFITLVSVSSLQALFDRFHDAFDLEKSRGNRFATAIDRSIRQGTSMQRSGTKWGRGVVIYYKIRCAIVHAGLSAPIYDSFPDGRNLLEAVLPVCEAIILDFLGIRVI